jgi:hypothetical protein
LTEQAVTLFARWLVFREHWQADPQRALAERGSENRPVLLVIKPCFRLTIFSIMGCSMKHLLILSNRLP